MNMLRYLVTTSLILIVTSFSASAATVKQCSTEICVGYFKKIETGAFRGHADAMATLGQFYYYGYGTDVDKDRAFVYFKKAARLGNIAAQYKTGLIYLSHDKVKDLEKGARYLVKASNREFLNSTFLLGIVYMNKKFGLYDKEKADIYLAKAFARKHPDMPLVVYILSESEQISSSNYSRLFKVMQDNPLLKAEGKHSYWPDDGTEVITITSPTMETILDQQIMAYRRPKTSLGSRLPSASCRESVGCYTTWGVEGLEDFTFLTTF